MKLLTFEMHNEEMLGVSSMDEKNIIPLDSLDVVYSDMNDPIDNISDAERKKITEVVAEELSSVKIPKDHIKMRAPIIRPEPDIICLGIKYMAHAVEAGRYKQEAFGGERQYPIYFSKRVNEAVGDGEPVLAHADIVDSLDYEVELAVVIGAPAYKVSRKDALDCVFGYTILNDISARNIQTRHRQWYFGKSLDGFTPMGPCIVTTDEIPDPGNLAIKSSINGELSQDGNTKQMIFDVRYIISELSQGMTLLPGTIIATGTPAGVGMGLDPPRFLTSGDIMKIEVEKIGEMTNYIL